MNPNYLLKKIFYKKVLYLVNYKLKVAIEKNVNKYIDFRNRNYNCSINFSSHLFSSVIKNIDKSFFPIPEQVIKNYLDHSYEFLGTGWCNYSNSIDKERIILSQNKAHQKISREIFKEISDSNYKSINWNIDVYSRYTWPINKHWSECLTVINSGGIEIKNPWELGRLHHLVHFAAYFLTKECEEKEKIVIEFRNQFLDFYAANPPFMGVQWACPMDVAIRSVNLITSFILFYNKSELIRNDIELIKYFTQSIYLHGKFIFKFLENKPDLKNNHYLANLSGLIFISYILKENNETKKWFNYSINEFFKEVDHQFNADGSNFEASTAYHCLGGDIVVYTLSLLIGIKSERLTKLKNTSYFEVKDSTIHLYDKITEKINRISYFFNWILYDEQSIIQIGDNDNGFLIKSFPTWDNNLYEVPLNKKSLKLALSSFIRTEHSFSEGYMIKFPEFLVNILSNNKFIQKISITPTQLPINGRKKIAVESFKYLHEDVIRLNTPIILSELKSEHFQDFGISIFKAHGFFLSVVYGQVGQDGYGGHSHDDKLSVILISHNLEILIDPGTGCYIKDINIRNKFRSSKVHPYAISIDSSSSLFLNHSCFSFSEKFELSMLHVSPSAIKVCIKKNHKKFFREIFIENSCVKIKTYSNFEFLVGLSSLNKISTGYGIY